MDYNDMKPIGLVRLMLLDGVITQEQAVKYFPELAESEDEKIRKRLVEEMRNFQREAAKESCDTDFEFAKKAVAWLEKQGKKKEKTAMEAWKEMRLEVYAQASGNRHESNYSDNSTKIFSLNDVDEIFEKISDCYVEQKPVEWSEEDDKMQEGVITNLQVLADKLQYDGFCSNAELITQKQIPWLKSLKNKFNG